MKYNVMLDTISFSCICCEDDPYPCNSCMKEKSAYELGMYDGANNMPYINTFTNHNERECYDFGFKKSNIV